MSLSAKGRLSQAAPHLSTVASMLRALRVSLRQQASPIVDVLRQALRLGFEASNLAVQVSDGCRSLCSHP